MPLRPRHEHRHRQSILIGSFLPLCWLGMMIVHEAGHVAGAMLSGGTVNRVILFPLAISRTDVDPNPVPWFVVWAGPVVGCLLPLCGWQLCTILRCRLAWLIRFFAGFCLIANGAYIGVGSFEQIGDAGEMLRCGLPPWSLWLFGAVAVPAGFVLLHGQGRNFGLGDAKGNVDATATWICSVMLLIVLVGELLASGIDWSN